MSNLIYKNKFLYRILIKGLYGKNYLSRYKSIQKYISEGYTVTDVCSGDCALYFNALKGLNKYVAVDINSFGITNHGIKQLKINIINDEIPSSDYVVMQGSLYQFYPHHKNIVDKLILSAKKKIIITEPILNLASSNNFIISSIAKYMTNQGTGFKDFRFSKDSLENFLMDNYNKNIINKELIAGGREMLYVLKPNNG